MILFLLQLLFLENTLTQIVVTTGPLHSCILSDGKPVCRNGTLNFAHRIQDRRKILIGCQFMKAFYCGQLHIDAHSVCQIPGHG